MVSRASNPIQVCQMANLQPARLNPVLDPPPVPSPDQNNLPTPLISPPRPICLPPSLASLEHHSNSQTMTGWTNVACVPRVAFAFSYAAYTQSRASNIAALEGNPALLCMLELQILTPGMSPH